MLEVKTKQMFTCSPMQKVLEGLKDNILYRSFGVRATGAQHSETGEIDKSSLKFVELIDYNPAYDIDYLQNLRKKAMNWLGTVNPDAWLHDIRGGRPPIRQHSGF